MQILHHFQDYWNCIKEIIVFIEIKYPIYASQVIREISESDLENNRYHWFAAKNDFDYEKIYPDIINAFMTSEEIKKLKLLKITPCR